MTPREELVAVLQPLLPKPWLIITSERAADASGTTLRLQQRKIRRLAVAGTGVHEIDFDATLAVPGEDADRVEDDLDDELTAFVFALDSARIKWDEWTKSYFTDIGALGYQATITITASKE